MNKNIKLSVVSVVLCSTLFNLHKLVLFIVTLVRKSYLE